MDPGSALVAHLAEVSLRSLGLAVAAWVAIRVLRVRGAAGRHAVWTLTAAAMLLMAVLQPLLPPLALRVLRPAPAEPVAVESTVIVTSAPVLAEAPHVTPPAPRRARIDWRQALAAVYGAGVLLFAAVLASSYAFTRRLVRASRRVDSLGEGGILESDWIAVPATVGLLRPKILLPAEWREWPADKLAAALAHERMHVRRADWAVAVLAGLNRCLFWFHPLSWWLGRQLAALAEQACDDAAVLELGRRDCYARTLLDMTVAVQSGRGRMVWEAMAMARTAEVRTRIERILDETREIPRGWTRARWLAVAACSLPLFYMTVAVRVTAAQESRPAPEGVSQPEAGQAAAPAPEPAQSPSANPAPAASPQPRNPSRIDVPGPDMERRLIRKVEPVYPPEAIQQGIEGEVILETVIGADGRVKSARRIFGNPLLAEAAQAAVMKYVYRTPPESAGPGAEIGSTVTVVFRLPVEAARPPGFQNPAVIYKKEPEYTEEARKAHVNGEVELELIVGTDGVPGGIQVVKSLPLLDQAAIEAVGHWRFRPASLNGVPVEAKTRVTVNFRLLPVPTAPTPEPPAEAQPGAGAASQPAPGRLSQAQLVYKRDPEYPKEAQQAGERGVVELVASIGVDGRVKSVKALSGPPRLQKAAEEAVMQWVYKPTMLNGVPVENETHISIHFDRGDPAPPPAPAPAPAPPPSSTTAPVLLHRVDPEPPKLAQQLGQHGTVELAATIGADGRIKGVRVLKGPPMLTKAARDAVMQWIYKPGMQDGVPIENETHIAINFGQPVTAQAPPPPAPSSGSTTPAVLVHRVDPELVQQPDRNGTVELDATIGADGRVKGVKILKGPTTLTEAAQDAVMRWVYKPAMRDGVPVESETHSTLEFGQPGMALPSPRPAAHKPSQDSTTSPVLIHHVNPEIPRMAQQMGQHGIVEMLATIGVDGRVKGVRVLKGPPMLMKAAEDAVMQWVYKPVEKDGVPVEAETHVTINFAGM